MTVMRAMLLAAPAGPLAAIVHYAGALKSVPGLAALPFDLTLAGVLALAPCLALLLAGRAWRIHKRIALPLLGCGALWLWLVLAGVWSGSATVLAAKLPELVMMGPAMLAAGMMVAGDAPTLRRCALAALVIGLVVGATVAWGLATGGVVLGGRVGASPDQLRVQYQIAGLAIASAAGIAAVCAVESRGVARLAWLLLLALLTASALLPGGRVALLALGVTVAAAPMVALWRGGKPRAALLWPVALFAGASVAALALALDPTIGAGLRTLERLTGGGDLGEASARLPLWRAALAWAGEAAPFGLGTGGFTIAAGFGERRGLYPHNHALEALAEGGLPGLGFWLLAFLGGGIAAIAGGARAEAGRAARVAALALPMALTVMVSTDLGNRMAWFALGLALGLGITARDRAHV